MKKENRQRRMAVAIYPFYRGFSFVLFEGVDAPLDWGVREIRSRKRKNALCMQEVAAMLDVIEPQTVILEDPADPHIKRSKRICQLIDRIADSATERNISVRRLSTSFVHRVFLSYGAVTKYEIALAIGDLIPVFKTRLPRRRKAWMSKQYNAYMFDALALMITYYHIKG